MKKVNYAYFMLVLTTNEWLALKPKERFSYIDENIIPILKKYPEVKIRYFDSEAFCGEYSDIIFWETETPLKYQAIVEELRETEFWGYYFKIQKIIPSIESAFEIHYDRKTLQV